MKFIYKYCRINHVSIIAKIRIVNLVVEQCLGKAEKEIMQHLR